MTVKFQELFDLDILHHLLKVIDYFIVINVRENLYF